MRTSNTLAAVMLAMGTLSTALPADANGLAARADPFQPQQQGPQQQQGQFGQQQQGQQQQGQIGQGYGQQGPQGYGKPGQNYNQPQLDVGCPDCDKYSHHAYENSNTKSSHTHCENGCCACKPEPKPEPCCKPEPKNECERKHHHHQPCNKPCCQGKYPFQGERRA